MHVQPIEKGVFMNQSPLKQLIELVKFDQQILAIEHSVASFEVEVAQLEGEVTQMEHQLEVTTQHKRTMRKAVDANELRMKELDQQERDTKKKLDAVQNQREYEPLIKQMKTLQKTQHEFEEELLDSWKQFEIAKKQYEQKKEYVEQKVKLLDAQIHEKMQSIEKLKTQIQELSKGRPAKEASIPAELIEKYQVMRKRVSDPVVPVQQASCSACFYLIAQQDLISIQRGALKQCRNCFRFLYHVPQE